jgi:pimeloyl-ACP methyl ester carboxylesterase
MLSQCVGQVKALASHSRSSKIIKTKKHLKSSPPARQSLYTVVSRNYFKSTLGGIREKAHDGGGTLRTALPALPVELLSERNPFFSTVHVPKTPERLHVHEYGTGNNNVVMLHGLSQTGEAWKPLLEHMNTRQFRYICPDLLGHGESSCTPYLKYTPNTHLHYLQRDVTSRIGSRSGLIIGPQSQQPFRLVGVGLGALLALELASRMPSRVLSLHLLSLPCYENETEASEDLLSHLIHPMGQFKFLSRMSSALISYNEDIMKPIIDISRVVAAPRSPDAAANLPEQIHATCSTVDECMVKHRILDSAAHLERAHLRMDLIQGADDTAKHNQMAERFFSKFVNTASIFYLDGATSDIPKSNPEALGLLLTRDYLSNTQ